MTSYNHGSNMSRSDWKYITISKEMALALETILRKEKKKYMIQDKTELIRIILRQFISSYEKGKFYEAQESIRQGLDGIVKHEYD